MRRRAQLAAAAAMTSDQLRAGYPEQPASLRRPDLAGPPAYASAGGGPVLDQALDYDPGSHTSDNRTTSCSRGLRGAATEDVGPLLVIPEEHRRQAR